MKKTLMLVIVTVVAQMAAAKTLKANGWMALTSVAGDNGVTVRREDGRSFCRLDVQPSGRKLGRLLKCRPVQDGLELDLRDVFKAGAKMVLLKTDGLAAEGLCDADVAFSAELTGPVAEPFPSVEVTGVVCRPGGTVDCLSGPKNKVITTRAVLVCPDRRRYALNAIVSGEATALGVTLKFSSAGSGPVVFHGPKVGKASPRPLRMAAENRELFHATFDGTLVAEKAGGRAKPLATNALAFVEGRHGQALRFDRKSASRLVYASKGNVNPERGTMTCWMRHDFPVREVHSLFALSAGKEGGTGDGSLRVFWRGYGTLGILSWMRGDYQKSSRQWGPMQSPVPTDGWVQMTVAWDACGVRLFANGKPVPRGRISDNTCPLNDALFEPPEAQFAKGWQERISLMMVGCGGDFKACWSGAIDDLRIWSEPFDAAEAAAFYRKDSGLPERAASVWDEPWRDPKTPPRPNRAMRPATETPGVPAGMELVEDVSPAELARSNAKERFRSTGQWTVGACDGLPYLEAGKNRNDRFAIRFRLDGTVPLWCFELTYPDDKARAIDLVIQNCRNAAGYSMNNGIETGLEHPLTGRNATKRFLYWRGNLFPTPERNGDLALVAMTQTEENPAALSRIRVYAIRDGRIPMTKVDVPVPVGGMRRHSAIWFEDPAIMHDFGTMGARGENEDPLLMIDRISAYMSYTGQDMLVYPAVWYAGIIGSDYMPRRHMPHFMREVCRRFERDGHVFVPSINQQWFPQLGLKIGRSALTDGSLHATPISILDTGLPNLGGWHHSPTYYNISHPDVQKALLDEVDALCEECRDHRSFVGVAIDPFNAVNVTWWGSIAAGYNDYSVDAFEKATGVRVPVDRDDPMRGRAYASWLKANAYDKWVQWRCDVLTDFYRRAAERIRSHRGDLTLFIRCSVIWRTKLEQRPDLFRDDFTDRILRESGIDCAALSRLPGVSLASVSMPAYWHDELHSFKAPKETLERIRDLPETEGYQRLILGSSYPFADFHESYYETSVGAKNLTGRHSGDGRLNGDWLVEKPWRVTHFAASGREALRPYAKALKYGDVFAYGRGGYLLGTSGDEAVTAPYMRAFRSLPAAKFADVKGFSHPDARFRTAKVGGTDWYYVVNTGYDPVELTLDLPEGTVDAVTGGTVGKALRLDSYELRALRRSSALPTRSPTSNKE